MSDIIDLTVEEREGSFSDKELKEAILLSLQPSSQSDHNEEVARDEEDEQLKLAIQLSLGKSIDAQYVPANDKDATSRKRRPSESPTLKPIDKRPRKQPDDIPCSEIPVFPQGTVKKTWAIGRQREDDIKIEEVLQSCILETAVLSSFQWDCGWLFSKINYKRTEVTLVMDENDPNAPKYHAQYSGIRITGPKGNLGIMHSKLMLLFYKKYARIVVPTANLVPHDWGETGFMENMVFLIDLPYQDSDDRYRSSVDRVHPDTITEDGPYTHFFEGLLGFCNHMGLRADLLEKLWGSDFTATRNYGFVCGFGASIRSHEDIEWASEWTGLRGLMQQVRFLGLSTSGDIQVDVITSSLGYLTAIFLSGLYLACKGDDPFTLHPDGPQEQLDALQRKETRDATKSHLRVYFPSAETVKASRGGPDAAGTICFSKFFWDKRSYPKAFLQDCVSSTEGLLMHNKIIYVQPIQNHLTASSSSSSSPSPSSSSISSSSMSSSSPSSAWAYLGSANCTESAWGKSSPNHSGPFPTGKNWECGVIIPVPRERMSSPVDPGEGKDAAHTTKPGLRASASSDPPTARNLDIFKGTVPVPFTLPAKQLSETNLPWFNDPGE